jgi:hypothetical protein
MSKASRKTTLRTIFESGEARARLILLARSDLSRI